MHRVVAGSYAGWPSARTGGPVTTEDDPLDAAPGGGDARDPRGDPLPGGGGPDRARHRPALRRVLRARAPAWRPDGEQLAEIRRRRFPVVGDGAGVWSFVHVADAAEATVAAIEADRPGLYNVVDDEPAPVADWLPEVARAIGAKPPRHVPRPDRPAARGRGGDRHDDRGAGRVEREGEGRAGLGAAAPLVARRAGRGGGGMSASSPHEEVLADVRTGAFALAYRMLGSVAEAEDVVQEALLRLHDALEAGEEIRSPRAFATTVTTRLAIDQLRSARRRREQYVGEWLPEPLLTDGGAEDPAHAAELADSLSTAFLVLLEQLSPQQRAALLLHDVFDYGYDEIAAIIGSSTANARQLAARARRHVDDGQAALRGVARRGATSSPGASSPPRATATWRRSRSCSRRTSCCRATAAARRRRWPARCAAGRASPARWPPGRATAPGSACGSSRRRSTASPARCCATREDAVFGVMTVDIAERPDRRGALRGEPREARPRALKGATRPRSGARRRRAPRPRSGRRRPARGSGAGRAPCRRRSACP